MPSAQCGVSVSVVSRNGLVSVAGASVLGKGAWPGRRVEERRERREDHRIVQQRVDPSPLRRHPPHLRRQHRLPQRRRIAHRTEHDGLEPFQHKGSRPSSRPPSRRRGSARRLFRGEVARSAFLGADRPGRQSGSAVHRCPSCAARRPSSRRARVPDPSRRGRGGRAAAECRTLSATCAGALSRGWDQAAPCLNARPHTRARLAIQYKLMSASYVDSGFHLPPFLSAFSAPLGQRRASAVPPRLVVGRPE